MNTVLWIVQGLLAMMFMMVGVMKIMQPYEKFKEMMGWAEEYSPTQIKSIGVVEIMGAMGVVLPWLTGILTFLTPLAAVGLGVTMLSASMVHIRRKEMLMLGMNMMLFAMAAFVAYGRFFLEF